MSQALLSNFAVIWDEKYEPNYWQNPVTVKLQLTTPRTCLEGVNTESDGVAAEEDDDDGGEEHGHCLVPPLASGQAAQSGGLLDLPPHERVHDCDQQEGEEHH